jgi:hypothetical protein
MAQSPSIPFGHSGFGHSDLIRISGFGFRASNLEVPMHPETAHRKRDLRLRRRLLMLMHAARVRPEQGWATGRFLVDVADGALPGPACFEDDAHAIGLLHDLVAGGYAERRDDRRRRRQPEGLDFTSYRITHKGVALVEEHIEPDPLIEDDRMRRAPRRDV